MTGAQELVRELNEAVENRDWEALRRRLHPDVIWRHNIGAGSPEEGEYRGREDVIALYERILEPWARFRVVPIEVGEAPRGVLTVTGELHAKHAAVETELVTPYMMRIEIEDGLLKRGEMVTGPRVP